METEFVSLSKLDNCGRIQAIARAGEIIREGGLVAFPTETVYGLGADAMNVEAAARIYEAKGRPSDNPLIAHIADRGQEEDLADYIPEAARLLMYHFWPGPLTIILRKKPQIPDQTTGGLPTIAIRMPAHPVAAELIRQSGRIIAAPSANLSGRPSPTRAVHVYEDMKGRIPMILDGGDVSIGIESTIVDLTEDVPLVLRPGYIRPEEIRQICGCEVRMDPAVISRTPDKNIKARAPGMKYRHYAPRGELSIVDGPAEAVVAAVNAFVDRDKQKGYKVGVIASEELAGRYRAHVVRSVGSRAAPETVAAGLYRILREMDALSCQRIYSECFYDNGIGDAVMNRLIKAAGYRMIRVRESEEREGFVIQRG